MLGDNFSFQEFSNFVQQNLTFLLQSGRTRVHFSNSICTSRIFKLYNISAGDFQFRCCPRRQFTCHLFSHVLKMSGQLRNKLSRYINRCVKVYTNNIRGTPCSYYLTIGDCKHLVIADEHLQVSCTRTRPQIPASFCSTRVFSFPFGSNSTNCLQWQKSFHFVYSAVFF